MLPLAAGPWAAPERPETIVQEHCRSIEVHGIDRKGMLNDVTDVISNKMNVNIRKVSFTADQGIFEGKIDIRVHDRAEAKHIAERLKKIPDLKEVQQIY